MRAREGHDQTLPDPHVRCRDRVEKEGLGSGADYYSQGRDGDLPPMSTVPNKCRRTAGSWSKMFGSAGTSMEGHADPTAGSLSKMSGSTGTSMEGHADPGSATIQACKRRRSRGYEARSTRPRTKHRQNTKDDNH